MNKIVHVKKKNLQLTKFLYVYLVAHETLLFIEHLFTKSKKLCFALNYTIFVQLQKYLQVA